ncbi:T-cell surface glycoprotein CD8 alpha chain isoform X2 [Cyclopterus lumpus]|nr:T-cell surface glycoprotein CD8 alpha chain isoform X2 [Cyclopterus lumpus]
MKIQKWILVTLVFCQKMPSGAGEEKTVKDGDWVDLACAPNTGATLVIWLRVLGTGMEFIASFTKDGYLKSSTPSSESTFSDSMRGGILRLKSFDRTRDSGAYSCASLVSNKLEFGQVTRLVGVEVAVEAPQPTAPNQCPTAAPCACNNKEKMEPGETRPRGLCSLGILGALAGGCGLLLLLLIVSTVYCNHLRTRRCPHHYKRKPRLTAPGKHANI